ncbi:hypothetical protein Dsin_022033 [Dipteronia sinensis]|uniref:Transmembrane protein n=1 Tax=Dipteronia sinensis TaxID=43782 RepID=A0AAE0A106_9ROSI|nr:hypothetical protein Dsin_022033 [Dipteronia sinensis]
MESSPSTTMEISIVVDGVSSIESFNGDQTPTGDSMESPPLKAIYMAYLCKIALIFVLVTFFYIAPLEGRKVLNMENMKGGRPLVPEHNLVASHVLHNGPTPISVQMAQNGRISVTLHNAAIYRFQESVPSPGIGN